jgi:hypothetical protein
MTRSQLCCQPYNILILPLVLISFVQLLINPAKYLKTAVRNKYRVIQKRSIHFENFILQKLLTLNNPVIFITKVTTRRMLWFGSEPSVFFLLGDQSLKRLKMYFHLLICTVRNLTFTLRGTKIESVLGGSAEKSRTEPTYRIPPCIQSIFNVSRPK